MKNRFAKAVENIKNIYGNVFSRYPISMILVILTTIYSSVFIVLEEHLKLESATTDCLGLWLVFLLYFLVGVFGIETIPKSFYEKNGVLKKTVGIVIAAVMAEFIVTGISNLLFGIVKLNPLNPVAEELMAVWAIGYIILVLLFVFYNRFKQNGVLAEKYFVSVFTGNLQVAITWGILALGIFLLTLCFEELIVYVDACGYVIPQILVAGLYVVPFVMMNITEAKAEIGRFFEALIKYVLLILTIIGAAIIYIYIVKTIVTGIPSNEIFEIASALFFVAIPVGFACTAFEKNSLLQKIAFILPYIYVPFIFLQAYAIIVRINEYGVTPSRYMGVVLVILEVLYTVVYATGKKNLDKLLMAMMAITVIITIVPGINVSAVSRASQTKVIEGYIENGLPSLNKEKARCRGAYYYLLYNYGEDYVKEILSKEQIEELESIKSDGERKNESEYWKVRSVSRFVDIEGYDYMGSVNFSEYVYYDDAEGLDPSKIKITFDDEEFGTYDMSEVVDGVIKRCKDENSSRVDTDDFTIYEASDDCKFVFSNVEITKNLDTDEFTHIELTGYVLFNESYYAVE